MIGPGSDKRRSKLGYDKPSESYTIFTLNMLNSELLDLPRHQPRLTQIWPDQWPTITWWTDTSHIVGTKTLISIYNFWSDHIGFKLSTCWQVNFQVNRFQWDFLKGKWCSPRKWPSPRPTTRAKVRTRQAVRKLSTLGRTCLEGFWIWISFEKTLRFLMCR